MLAFGHEEAIRFGFSLVIITFLWLSIPSFVFIIACSQIFGFCFFVLPVISAIYFFIIAISAELHSSLFPVLIFVQSNWLPHLVIKLFAANQLVNLKQIQLLIELFFFSNLIFLSVFFQHSL